MPSISSSGCYYASLSVCNALTLISVEENYSVIARNKFELCPISCVSFFGPTGGPSQDKKKYEHLTLAIRQTVLERARNRCQKCRVKFTPSVPPQFEHINGSLKDNRPVNLRALCPECFKSVEKKEKSGNGIFSKIRNIVG